MDTNIIALLCSLAGNNDLQILFYLQQNKNKSVLPCKVLTAKFFSRYNVLIIKSNHFTTAAFKTPLIIHLRNVRTNIQLLKSLIRAEAFIVSPDSCSWQRLGGRRLLLKDFTRSARGPELHTVSPGASECMCLCMKG